MSARYTQSKSETAKHAEILKGMLKKPENKLCADCKRNDPRWASTNLGCFMCIRCSGIHRGMGVHITRIKSVDLDTWSPEQIENIQRWGNKRANAYWEAHLKAGHAPPEHKMESFIRSKYESRRWAMEGPVPEPETLDGEGSQAPAPTPTATAAAPVASSSRVSATKAKASTSFDLLGGPPAAPSAQRSAVSPPAVTSPAAAAPPASSGGGGLFDLDFGSPAPTAGSAPTPTASAPQPKKDAKADILSLFASSTPAPKPPNVVAQQYQQQLAMGMGGMNLGGSGAADPWGQTQQQQAPQQQQPFGGMNVGLAGAGANNGFGAFEGFGAPTKSTTTDPFASSANVWGNPSSTATSNSNDLFGDFSSGGGSGGFGASSQAQKKPDAFSDIWN